jgi:hypothetical protein
MMIVTPVPGNVNFPLPFFTQASPLEDRAFLEADDGLDLLPLPRFDARRAFARFRCTRALCERHW